MSVKWEMLEKMRRESTGGSLCSVYGIPLEEFGTEYELRVLVNWLISNWDKADWELGMSLRKLGTLNSTLNCEFP